MTREILIQDAPPGSNHPRQRRGHRRLHREDPRTVITAVDTNVLLDILLGDERHGPESLEWLKTAYDAGAIVMCDIVHA